MENSVWPSREHNVLVDCTSTNVAAYVAKNKVKVDAVAEIIGAVYSSLAGIDESALEPPVAAQTPAVPVKKSVFPDYLICLEDGLKLKMLKRHLRTSYGITPEQYRAKWNLPADYPMAAPNYTLSRSAFAKQSGFGTNRARKWSPRKSATG
jgi:predicted transcriptional regulator